MSTIDTAVLLQAYTLTITQASACVKLHRLAEHSCFADSHTFVENKRTRWYVDIIHSIVYEYPGFVG